METRIDMYFRSSALLLYGALAMAVPVSGQPTPAKSDPADPSAPVSAFRYESVFTDYQPYRDEKLAPWRDVNDEVALIGGHIGILKGAAGKPAAAPSPDQRK